MPGKSAYFGLAMLYLIILKLIEEIPLTQIGLTILS